MSIDLREAKSLTREDFAKLPAKERQEVLKLLAQRANEIIDDNTAATSTPYFTQQ